MLLLKTLDFAAASDNLLRDMTRLGEIFKGTKGSNKKDTIFCSELVAYVYRAFGLPSFAGPGSQEPKAFTPVEIEVVPEFDGLVFYAKEGGAEPVGVDGSGNGVYVVRVYIGNSVHVGMQLGPPPSSFNQNSGGVGGGLARLLSPSKRDAAGRPAPAPQVPYGGRALNVRYGHQVLVTLRGLVWTPCLAGGRMPPNALRAGIEEDGEGARFLHPARCVLDRRRLAGLPIGPLAPAPALATPPPGDITDGDDSPAIVVELPRVAYEPSGQPSPPLLPSAPVAVGKAADHIGGALFPIGGREVLLRDGFEVLCFETR
ncbi:hypothetical protein HK405_002315 [Cladochytrium tenue]|nr:hypothetical protein HK405_002315 [Cladochytrium tenue]